MFLMILHRLNLYFSASRRNVFCFASVHFVSFRAEMDIFCFCAKNNRLVVLWSMFGRFGTFNCPQIAPRTVLL